MTPRAGRASALQADIRTVLQRLGEPAALSFPVVLIYLPFAFAGPVFIDTRRMGGSVALWFLVGLAGWLALLLVLTLARWVITPLRRGRPVATIAAIAVSVAVRSVVLTLSAQALGLATVGEFAYRLNAAIFTQSAFLIASAIVVSSFVHHGQLAASLLLREEKLTRLSAESTVRLEDLRSQIGFQVRRAIDPLIAQLDDISQRVGPDRDSFHRTIEQIVDEELRPLSHRLADAAAVTPPEESAPESMRTPRPPLPDRVLLRTLFRPVPSGLLAALLASSQAVRAANVTDGVAFTLALSVSLAMGVAGLRLAVARIEVRSYLGLVTASLAVAIVFALIVLAWEQTAMPMPPYLHWAAFYSGLFIGALLALERVINDRRTATEQQLRESVERLQTQSSMLRQHEFIASRRLSYIVHGSVQAALNAASMRLAMAEIPDEQLVASIRADIDEAIERIDTSGSAYVMLVKTLGDLVDLWEGTARFMWTMDHRTVRVLAESPPTAASVGEIVTECVSNAIRHGGARHINARIESAGDLVRIQVTDDGSGLPALHQPGLGTRMLDELCLSWERRSSVASTKVLATLATERVLQPG